MKAHHDYVLQALIHAVGLKTTGPVNQAYFEVTLTASNVKKVTKIAESMKYGGAHLVVEFKDYDDSKWLKLWAEINDDTNYQSEMTLINIEHDLESLI